MKIRKIIVAVVLALSTGSRAEQVLRGVPCFFSDPAYATLEARQKFIFDAEVGGTIINAASSECLTALSPSKVNSAVVFAPCVAGAAAQTWKPVTNTSGLQLKNGAKVGAASGGVRTNLKVWVTNAAAAYTADAPAATSSLHASAPGVNGIWWDATNAAFHITPRAGFNHQAGKNLCLDWAAAPLRVCDAPSPSAKLPFCDVKQPLDARVADLVGRLTPAEVENMVNRNTDDGIDRLWIQPYNWWSEALHGVQAGCAQSSANVSSSSSTLTQPLDNCPVNMPSAISSAAPFDKQLFAEIGAVIGTEARALWNEGVTNGLTFWSPNLNIFRDPRWGRGQETAGEDPTVNGEYGMNFIRAFQTGDASSNSSSGSSSSTQLMASSCAKHFLSYTLENCYNKKDNCRLNFNAIVSQQELESTYLPAFEAAVKTGGVSGLMCSYNAINDIPACANKWAMTTVARNAWNFDGYITSDCGAISGVSSPYPAIHNWSTHGIGSVGHGFKVGDHNLSSLAEAGVDSNCNLGGGSIVGAQGGSGADAKAAAGHLFKVQMRVGLFDSLAARSSAQKKWDALSAKDVGTSAHVATALDAARAGIVLLKNTAKRLPLAKAKASDGTTISIAVIGPCAASFKGGYSNNAPVTSIDAAIAASGYAGANANIKVVTGCDSPSCATLSSLDAAVAAAAAADVVILALGIDGSIEGENGDGRAFVEWGIALPGSQSELAAKISAAAKSPVIAILTGAPVDMTPLKTAVKVGAIMWIGYLGQMGGAAVADVLFGVHNPSGRLTTTVYPADYIDEWKTGVDPYVHGAASPPRNASYFDAHLVANATSGNPGRTYRFYTGSKEVYKFGDGMSYTEWAVEGVDAEAEPTVHTVDFAQVTAYATEATRSMVYRRGGAHDAVVHRVALRIANVGAVKGRHSVLCYVVPPSSAHAAMSGLPLRSLVDFTKTATLAPGEEAAVKFALTAHDLTVCPPGGGRIALKGTWEIKTGENKTVATLVVA
jgi:beta-glucosidase-like glycosyl hydrolase